MTTGLTGEIKAGDAVRTLNRSKAVYGRVVTISKLKIASVRGRTQPGAPVQLVSAHVENLDKITDDELCPEDQPQEAIHE